MLTARVNQKLQIEIWDSSDGNKIVFRNLSKLEASHLGMSLIQSIGAIEFEVERREKERESKYETSVD